MNEFDSMPKSVMTSNCQSCIHKDKGDSAPCSYTGECRYKYDVPDKSAGDPLFDNVYVTDEWYSEQVKDVLSYLNTQTDKLILRGGAAMHFYYGFEVPTEVIEMDTWEQSLNLDNLIGEYCKIKSWHRIRRLNRKTSEEVVIQYDETSKGFVNIMFRVYKRLLDKPATLMRSEGIRTYSLADTFHTSLIEFALRINDYADTDCGITHPAVLLYQLLFMFEHHRSMLDKADIQMFKEVLYYNHSRNSALVECLRKTNEQWCLDYDTARTRYWGAFLELKLPGNDN